MLKDLFYKSEAALMLEEFHKVFVPKNRDVKILRAYLLDEEYEEVQGALASGDRLAIAKELADLVYVAYGTALVYDIDLDIALKEVHKSNMTKLDDAGKPVLRKDGKVLKGPNYKPPDMRGALRSKE
jgi:predicted HAD superfamily Cof-like phosphohydrolase